MSITVLTGIPTPSAANLQSIHNLNKAPREWFASSRGAWFAGAIAINLITLRQVPAKLRKACQFRFVHIQERLLGPTLQF